MIVMHDAHPTVYCLLKIPGLIRVYASTLSSVVSLVISWGISKHKMAIIHSLSDISSEQQSLSYIEACQVLHEGQAIVAASQAEATA